MKPPDELFDDEPFDDGPPDCESCGIPSWTCHLTSDYDPATGWVDSVMLCLDCRERKRQ